MSPARSPAKLCARCPYCAHVSPDESKFCNECGAALHLQPCPHCGAVNDVTRVDHCARCNGDLHPPTLAVAMPEPEAETAPGSAPEPAFDDCLQALPPHAPLQPRVAKPLPLWLTGGGIALAACAAVYGYVVVQQQRTAPSVTESTVREAVAAPPSTPSTPPPNASVITSTNEQALLTTAPPAAGPVEIKTTAFEASVADDGAAPRPAPRKPAPRRAPEPAEARTPTPSRSTVEPPPPKIGPCTDAVAALGLCSNATDATTRKP